MSFWPFSKKKPAPSSGHTLFASRNFSSAVNALQGQAFSKRPPAKGADAGVSDTDHHKALPLAAVQFPLPISKQAVSTQTGRMKPIAGQLAQSPILKLLGGIDDERHQLPDMHVELVGAGIVAQAGESEADAELGCVDGGRNGGHSGGDSGDSTHGLNDSEDTGSGEGSGRLGYLHEQRAAQGASRSLQPAEPYKPSEPVEPSELQGISEVNAQEKPAKKAPKGQGVSILGLMTTITQPSFLFLKPRVNISDIELPDEVSPDMGDDDCHAVNGHQGESDEQTQKPSHRGRRRVRKRIKTHGGGEWLDRLSHLAQHSGLLIQNPSELGPNAPIRIEQVVVTDLNAVATATGRKPQKTTSVVSRQPWDGKRNILEMPTSQGFSWELAHALTMTTDLWQQSHQWLDSQRQEEEYVDMEEWLAESELFDEEWLEAVDNPYNLSPEVPLSYRFEKTEPVVVVARESDLFHANATMVDKTIMDLNRPVQCRWTEELPPQVANVSYQGSANGPVVEIAMAEGPDGVSDGTTGVPMTQGSGSGVVEIMAVAPSPMPQPHADHGLVESTHTPDSTVEYGSSMGSEWETGLVSAHHPSGSTSQEFSQEAHQDVVQHVVRQELAAEPLEGPVTHQTVHEYVAIHEHDNQDTHPGNVETSVSGDGGVVHNHTHIHIHTDGLTVQQEAAVNSATQGTESSEVLETFTTADIKVSMDGLSPVPKAEEPMPEHQPVEMDNTQPVDDPSTKETEDMGLTLPWLKAKEEKDTLETAVADEIKHHSVPDLNKATPLDEAIQEACAQVTHSNEKPANSASSEKYKEASWEKAKSADTKDPSFLDEMNDFQNQMLVEEARFMKRSIDQLVNSYFAMQDDEAPDTPSS